MSTLKRCSHGPVKTYDYRILTAPPVLSKKRHLAHQHRIAHFSVLCCFRKRPLLGLIGSYVMWTLPPKGRGHQAAIAAQIERSEWRPEIGWVRDGRARPDAIGRISAGEGARFIRDGKALSFVQPSYSHF